MSNRFRFIYSESWRRKLSIGIYLGPIKGGGGRGGPKFLGPPLQNFTGPLLRNFKHIIGIPVQAQSIGTLFERIGLRKGVCGHVQKSEANALGWRPRGESSQ